MFQVNNNLLIAQENCPICLGKSKIIDSVKTMNKESDEIVSLRECCVCKHWWIDPLPKQELLSLWYKNRSGFVMLPSAYNGTSQDDIQAEKVFLRLTSCLKTPSFNYLEIGCGTGNLLKRFSKEARIAYGVEPGNWNMESGLNIITDIDLLPKDIKFDIIVLIDILEHISDPNAMMKKVSLVANKNAVIYLKFPNRDSLKAKIMKDRWPMVLPFGHLHFFSLKSIDQICEKNSFKILVKKATRCENAGIISLIKNFELSAPNKLYRLIKSLLLGQIILGKDQWDLILIK